MASCSNSMGQMTTNLEGYYTQISLEENASGSMIVRHEALVEHREEYCLVGKFISAKPVNAIAMKDTFALLWRPERGMFFKELPNNRFLFKIYHVLDINKVIDFAPWTFKQNFLLFKKIMTCDDLERLYPLLQQRCGFKYKFFL